MKSAAKAKRGGAPAARMAARRPAPRAGRANAALTTLLAGGPIQRCAACGGTCGNPIQRAAAPGGGPSDTDKLAFTQELAASRGIALEEPAQRMAAPEREQPAVQRAAAPERDKPLVQRAAAVPEREKPAVQRAAVPEREQPAVQRAAVPEREPPAVQRAAATAAAPAAAHAAAAAAPPGSALPAGTRRAMERGFGADFGGVRIHADAAAARRAEALAARAYTTGSSIHFARGEFQPDSPAGKRLLAHELAHVVQQRAGRVPAAGIDTPGDPFEREADAAAGAVLSGRPPAIGGRTPPSVQRASRPKEIEGDTVPAPAVLEIPAEKATANGDDKTLLGLYERAADAKALRATHAGRSKETSGNSTKTLWDKWAQTRPYLRGKDRAELEDAIKTMTDAGCQVDHIIELQLNGADDPSNMRALDGKRNMDAGKDLRQQMVAMWVTLRDANPDKPRSWEPILTWDGADRVRLKGAARPDPDCLDAELAASAGKAGKLAKGQAQLLPKIGGNNAFIDYEEGAGAVANTSLYAVPGFQLTKVEGAGPFELPAGVSPFVRRIPVLKPNSQYRFAVPTRKGGKLTMLGDKTIKAKFPALSEADLTIDFDEKGFKAEGVLHPSLALLRNVEIHLLLREGEFSGKAMVTPEALKSALPVPGLEITEASLEIKLVNGVFTAGGGFAIKYSTIADGKVEARIGPDGFVATGVLNLHVPGLDQAKGEVWVKQGKLGGKLTLGAEKLKFPGVRKANLVVTIQDGLLAGEGTLDLAVPGIKQARLGFGVDAAGNYAITGTAVLAIPGVQEAEAALTYRDGDLAGDVRAALAIPGLEGADAGLDLHFAHGQLTGTGRLMYKRGRLSGKVDVALDEKARLSGGGELAYEIAPGLEAFANLRIDPAGRTRVQGGLRVPETVPLFERRVIEQELFRLPTLEIPILAIPLGTRSAGLVGTISARVVARAGIGPGQLRKMRLIADFDPASESGAFAFQAAAELFVPADAELALIVGGGLGLSVALARAIGGIEAEGAVGAHAELIAGAELSYQAGQLAIGGKAELTAQPRLTFKVRAFVRVEADLVVTVIEVFKKEWALAQVEAGAGLKIGVRMPFNYVFGKPFELSADQIEFVRPELDAGSVMRQLLGA